MKPLLTFAVGLMLAGFSHAQQHRTITQITIGAVTKRDENRVLQMLSQGDKGAIEEMYEQGLCVDLDPGTVVCLIDVDLPDGLRGVRIKGHAAEVWIPAEVLSAPIVD